jgi:hypothetical protein
MAKVADVQKAIAELSPKELVKFRAWFATFDAKRFDEHIENDAKSGKTESLAQQAFKSFKAGRTRNL